MAYVKVASPPHTGDLCPNPGCCYCCTGGNFSNRGCAQCHLEGEHCVRSSTSEGTEARNSHTDQSHYFLPDSSPSVRGSKCQSKQDFSAWSYCQGASHNAEREPNPRLLCNATGPQSSLRCFCDSQPSLYTRDKCDSNLKHHYNNVSENLGPYNGNVPREHPTTHFGSNLKTLGANPRNLSPASRSLHTAGSKSLLSPSSTHNNSSSGNGRMPCQNQVLSDIHCQHSQTASQELAKASQHLHKVASAMESGWSDRQHYRQELEAVRSQLRSLRNHSAIALGKEPCEGKRLRRESEELACSAPGSRASPSLPGGIGVKRPRDVSPKLAPRSFSSQSGVWVCQQVSNASPESEQSDAALLEEDCEEEDGRRVCEEGSECGSNTPSLVGETLGSICISEPARPQPKPSPAPSNKPNNGPKIEALPEQPPQLVLKPAGPPLRASLFSFVPPFIRFTPQDEQQGTGLPPEVQRLLKWKLSPITPLVVRRTLLHSNFRLVRTSSDWCGTWGKHMKSACFAGIKDFQKMNHFPGTFQIGRKDRLWRNIHRLMLKFGKREFGFMPRTFILPQDIRLLRQSWEKTCGIERWIVKPPASARGTGIRVVHKWSQIPKKRPLVVQRYIASPYLINGSKFDLRLYVLVTSVHPLRIYLYDDGLVRFASVKYSSEMSSLHDRYMHLTNYSINKNSSQYTQNEDADACQGHKWTVKALWSHLAQQGVDVSELWARLEDLVVKTLVSGEASIGSLVREHVTSRYCCYELFGVDVLLDQNLRPWLLEVNISPSLHSSSPLDQAVKGPLVCDLLNMAGYHVPNKLPVSMQKELLRNCLPESKATQLCLDSRLYHVGLSREEAAKQVAFTKDCHNREDYLGQILQNLTPDDVRHLTEAEDEYTQAGRFLRIFPTPDSHHYHQFFEGPRYYNMLFDAWETRYYSNRAPGIALLEELCQQKVHLTIPALSARAKSSVDLESSPLPLEASGEEACASASASASDVDEEEETSTTQAAPATSTKSTRSITHSIFLRAMRRRAVRWRSSTRPSLAVAQRRLRSQTAKPKQEQA